MPGLVKIGRTDRNLDSRIDELSSSTGVPSRFTVYKSFVVKDSRSAERQVHDYFSAYRTNSSREFFQIDPELVVDYIEKEISSKPTVSNEWNFDKEDELVFQATQLTRDYERVLPSMINKQLNVTWEEAKKIRGILVARKLIDDQGVSVLWLEKQRAIERRRESEQYSQQDTVLKPRDEVYDSVTSSACSQKELARLDKLGHKMGADMRCLYCRCSRSVILDQNWVCDKSRHCVTSERVGAKRVSGQSGSNIFSLLCQAGYVALFTLLVILAVVGGPFGIVVAVLIGVFILDM